MIWECEVNATIASRFEGRGVGVDLDRPGD
jgi:hypothetical protein